jgi:GNAT superfamily N-acetyltransferase
MRVIPLSAVPPGALAELREIYFEAFPPEERLPFEELSAPSGGYDVTVLFDGTTVHGFAAHCPLSSFPALYLGYLAVSRARRSEGLGETLWRHLVGDVTHRSGMRGLVLEVEDPELAGAPNAEQRRRRIAFYRRVGAVMLPTAEYCMPGMDGADDVPMRLMWAPVRGTAAPAENQLPPLVLSLYDEVYKLSAGHPLRLAWGRGEAGE